MFAWILEYGYWLLVSFRQGTCAFMKVHANAKIKQLAEKQLVKDLEKYNKSKDKAMAKYQQKVETQGEVIEAYYFLVI